MISETHTLDSQWPNVNFFVQSTKFQYLKLIRENDQSGLDSRCTVPICQFMYRIKSNFIN